MSCPEGVRGGSELMGGYMGYGGGLGLIELLFVLALGVTLTGIAVPLTADALEETRVASAARNLAARIGGMRIDAVKRSTCIGMRFQRAGPADYSFELFVDGNGNGVRTAEISAGIDVRRPPGSSEGSASGTSMPAAR